MLYVVVRSWQAACSYRRARKTVDIVLVLCRSELDWLVDWTAQLQRVALLQRIFFRSKDCLSAQEVSAKVDLFRRRIQERSALPHIDIKLVGSDSYGRNDREFVAHIYANYRAKNFAEFVFFVKDSLGHYPISQLKRLNRQPEEVFRELVSGADFSCIRKPDNGDLPRASVLHRRRELWRFRLLRYVTAADYSTQILDSTYAQANVSFCGFLADVLSKTEFAKIRDKEVVPVCYGGAFAVRASALFRVSNETWGRISTTLAKHRNSELLHFMERSWAALLSSNHDIRQPALDAPDRFKHYEIVRFRENPSYPGMLVRRAWSDLSKSRESKEMQCIQSSRVALIVVHNYNLEGSINYVRHVVSVMASSGYHVLTIGPNHGVARDSLLKAGAAHALVWEELRPRYTRVTDLCAFMERKLQLKPSLIVFNTVLWSHSVMLNEPFASDSPRVVWVVHEWSITSNTLESDLLSRPSWFGERRPELNVNSLRSLLLGVDVLVFVAESQKALWQDFTSDDTFTIHGYADNFPPQDHASCRKKFSRQGLDISKHALILTIVGTVCPRKRQDWAIHALLALNEAGVEAVLLIVGALNDALSSPFFHSIKSARRYQNVRFIPETECTEELLRLSNIHLSASQSEVFPLNTIEAMRIGTPVIATRVGGTHEQFVHPESKWMLVEDSFEDFVLTVLNASRLKPHQLKQYGKLNAESTAALQVEFAIRWKSVLERVEEKQNALITCNMCERATL